MCESSKKSTAQDVVCKNHNARTEKDIYRICPAKLSKRELEDLYFALLESNLGLKKTINSQKEKIRELSTKVQRMTAAQRSSLSKEQKECCITSKAVCNEQKEIIADLKKNNDRLSERIKLLNMKLCSAKQFLQRNPLQSTSKCPKYSITNGTTLKNSSTSALNSKKSDNNLKSKAVSCQCLVHNIVKDENSTRAVQTETKETEIEIISTRSVEVETEMFDEAINESVKLCDENKCRTQMHEFKQKIVNLQEELSKNHEEYSTRITKLECVVAELRNENVRVRSERTANEHALQQREKTVQDMANRLRQAEAQYTDLAMQLSIERRKVAELETSVKLAQMSNSVVKTIEERLNANEAKLASLKDNIMKEPSKSPRVPLDWEETSPRLIVPSPVVDECLCTDLEKDATKISKYSDDSGYTEALNRSQDADDGKAQDTCCSVNEELADRIDKLQLQLDSVKKKIVIKDDLLNLKEPSTDQLKKTPSVRYTRRANLTEAVWETYDERASCSQACNDTSPTKNLVEIKIEVAPTNSPTKSEEISNTQTSVNKRDNDNRMQIPGPLPVDSYMKTNKKQLSDVDKFIRNYYNKKNVDNKDSDTKKVSKQAVTSNKESRRVIDGDSPRKNKNYIDRQTPDTFHNTSHRKNNDNIEKIRDSRRGKLNADLTGNVDGLKIEHKGFNIRDCRDFSVGINEFDISKKDDDLAIKSSTKDTGCNTKDDIDLIETKQYGWQGVSNQLSEKVKRDSIDVTKHKSMRDTPTKTVCCEGNRSENIKLEDSTESQLKEDGLRRDLCFKSDTSLVPATGKEMLDCGVQYEQSDVKDLGTQVDSQFRKQSTQQTCNQTSQSSPRTYTVQGMAQVTDHDTDCEISSMSDLPSENEKTPRKIYSPGENKLTTTYSDSYTSPYDMSEYRSLSEGELPGYGRAALSKLSQGEKPTTSNQKSQETSSSLKMEETLQAITEELARCKQLLLSQRSKEQPERRLVDAAASTDDFPEPIALKSSPGNQSIGDIYAPKCVFTLHIGTVVLSDEAVLNSRDLSLVLTWQFYDQNVAMTKVKAGRVVLFDFSTEYDVKISEEFLEYMKHEEMPIKICELDKQEQPFASCALPLRDALLHTNRRADMSLPLVAGPRMRITRRSRDALDRGDEMGVLDLWCMLRTEPSVMPAINRAIARPSSAGVPVAHCALNMAAGPTARVMDQVVDDQSNERRLFREQGYSVGLTNKRSMLENIVSGQWYNMDHRNNTEPYDRRTSDPNSSLTHKDSQLQSEYPNVSRRLSSTLQRRTSEIQKETFQLQHTPSNVIPNVVPTNIRSMEEMKQALGRHNQDSLTTRNTKKNERNSAARNLIQRMKNNLKKDKGGNSKDNVADPRSNKINDAHKKSVTIKHSVSQVPVKESQRESATSDKSDIALTQTIDITILWLALNEECNAMLDSKVQRLYVAYSFLGRNGAELETPVSLPKPRHYFDKCNFNFRKTFHLHDCDLPLLGHMARCRSGSKAKPSPKDCIIFTVVSEPPEDPLGLDCCEDIGYAYLHLGDIIACASGSNGYTEVVTIRAPNHNEVCGVLAVRVDHLDVLRRCLALTHSNCSLHTSALRVLAPLPCQLADAFSSKPDTLQTFFELESISCQLYAPLIRYKLTATLSWQCYILAKFFFRLCKGL
ncbi:hypothetical protein K1T71_002184 [Dendrolimus kikuchii]|uniref:Uncharacterized protein n=1 Tax=Dendrolimus kikuchii TaxID=765133 RepID=A0ACC1DG74_9NEOP|nr:hypothetical protein K1T71_002184 [Dendrolimus kikuchii]